MAQKIISCFFDKNKTKSDVVEATGKNVVGWSCPTDILALENIMADVEQALADGCSEVVLNFCHYPTNWQKTPMELLDTCYCDRCLKLFSKNIGEAINGASLEDKVLLIDGSYYIEWMNFKMNHITNLVKTIKAKLTETNSSILLKLVIPPWENKENGEGMKRLLGFDLNTLSEFVDEFQILIDANDPKAVYFKENLIKVEFISPNTLL